MPDQRLPDGLKSPSLLSAITRSGNHKGAGDGFILVLNNCPFCIFIRLQNLYFFQSKAGTQSWINEELKSHFFEAASAEVAFLQGCTSQLLRGAAPLCGTLRGSEALARTFVMLGTNRIGRMAITSEDSQQILASISYSLRIGRSTEEVTGIMLQKLPNATGEIQMSDMGHGIHNICTVLGYEMRSVRNMRKTV
ncbi:hypothetical protein RHSIM_Rhsim13G0168300 [Rhododendron simsii]|uniref:Uncharacterized protein n=1 Tax=Rhododendron simsii TaxID=118357 RepID=A0A834FY89_RHOSS|nr:hypothetical protein RHSIM_Rhsim13G0168300 [Rhododendron simsii]